MFGFRKRPVRTLDDEGMPIWMAMSDGEGFFRSIGGTWMLRMPLDYILGRPGTEVMSSGFETTSTLPAGTALRLPRGSFVGEDGVSIAPSQAAIDGMVPAAFRNPLTA